jgi:hypothetical protein
MGSKGRKVVLGRERTQRHAATSGFGERNYEDHSMAGV